MMHHGLMLFVLLSRVASETIAVTADGTTTGPPTLVTMGEAMLRFAPVDDGPVADPTRHTPHPFLRSLGGDELNVAVALRLVGAAARWISVLPTGPLGDVVAASCAHYNISFAGQRVEGAEMGTFFVIPEARTVHYQRRNSAFALHEPNALEWHGLLAAPRPWLHVTGITPAISPAARASWENAVAQAAQDSIPTSCDLNHRKQLGTLAELWAIVSPYASGFELLILSIDQLNGLGEIEGLDAALWPVAHDAPDEAVFELMAALQLRIRCARLALCRKVRDAATGVQRRWSVLTMLPLDVSRSSAESPLRYSTYDEPVYHTPLEELGGGSAWAAGMLHALHFEPLDHPLRCMRRADLLASLCQQSAGDFSTVSAAQLREHERRFNGRAATLPPPSPPSATGLSRPSATSAAAAAPTHADVQEAAAVEAKLDATLTALRAAKVVGIIRAKGAVDVAVARGLELAELGYRAIEVTLDSSDWPVRPRAHP